ncbi:MAG TPA: alpha/beta fold hydrolase [Candidatus Dormibacteraeota bacterium]
MRFDSDGISIAYDLLGPDDGIPTILLHGFASDFRLNWEGSRWIETLVKAGRLVVGLDQRGHGRSDKPHEVEAYLEDRMVEDVVRLLDGLQIGEADLLGYSMGGRLSLRMAATLPDRIGKVVVGGVGLSGGVSSAEAIAARLRGESGPGDLVADTFYQFAAARPTNDLEALAACILGLARSEPLDPGRVRKPLLIVNGERDELAPGGAELAQRFAEARFVELSGRDHMSAVTDRRFKDAALAFFA